MQSNEWFEWGYRDGIEESVINRRRSSIDLANLNPYYIAGYKAGAVDWYHCKDDFENSWKNFKKDLTIRQDSNKLCL